MGWKKHLKDVPASAKKATAATKKKPQKSTPKKKKPRRKTPIAPRKKRKSSGGFRLPGGLGPKGILTGIIAMATIPRFLPVTSPGAGKLGAGLVLRALKLGGGGALSSVGIMELAAEMIMPVIGGYMPGGNGAGARGGTDF